MDRAHDKGREHVREGASPLGARSILQPSDVAMFDGDTLR
jgi:hypothetical protein